MAYQHVGGNDYKITFQMWRDCATINDPSDLPTDMSFWIRNESGMGFNQSGGIINSSFNVPIFADPAIEFESSEVEQSDPCITNVPEVCFETGIWRFDVTLPSTPGVYEISTDICCRNEIITNLLFPADQFGATFFIDIPHNLLDDNNNSAIFVEFPPGIVCLGSPLVYDHSAFDADGDSLVYGLYTPFDQGNFPNYPPVVWEGGFSVDNQLGGDPPMSIDPETGLLTASADTPGQYVVGIYVEEWRDGELICTNRRDFQFGVTNECQFVQVTTGIEQEEIDLIGVGEYEVNSCTSLDYVFENTSPGSNANADSVTWIGLDALQSQGAFVTDPIGGSFDPQITFPFNGTYELQFTASVGDCADTATVVFNMNPPSAIIGKTSGCGDKTIQFTNNSFGALDSVLWDFGDPNVSALENQSTDFDTEHTYEDEGTYYVSFTTFIGDCFKETIDSIVIAPPFSVSLDGDSGGPICPGTSVQLDGLVDGGDDGFVTYNWEPFDEVPDQGAISNTVAPLESTWFKFRAETDTGCESVDSVFVEVQPYPEVSISEDEIPLCDGNSVIINASVVDNNFSSVVWVPNTDIVDGTSLNPTVNPSVTTSYDITAFTEAGCSGTANVKIVVPTPVDVNIVNTPDPICEGDQVTLEAVSDQEVTWEGVEITNPNALSQTITPSTSGTYRVSVTNGCDIVEDSVTVQVDEQPIISAGSDLSLSFEESGQLQGTVNNSDFPIVWSPPIGLTDPSDPNTTAQPPFTQPYTMSSVNGECKAEDFVTVFVSADIYIQATSGFSPNGDGQNDRLVFVTNGIEEVLSMEVYDRWGKQVYSGTGFDAGWDGVYLGEKQPVGVYVYYIVATTVFGQEFMESGNSTLVH